MLILAGNPELTKTQLYADLAWVAEVRADADKLDASRLALHLDFVLLTLYGLTFVLLGVLLAGRGRGWWRIAGAAVIAGAVTTCVCDLVENLRTLDVLPADGTDVVTQSALDALQTAAQMEQAGYTPANGAVYVVQDVIVRNAPSGGGVHGRVTVASNDDIIVGDNISFVTSGEDVLGLVAKNNVYIAKYTPDPLTWSAGVIAQTGTWQARDWSTTKKSLMTFRGMAATDDGGSFAGMFTTRDYGYDPSFEWLPPPWFPIVEDAYTVLFFRELPSST